MIIKTNFTKIKKLFKIILHNNINTMMKKVLTLFGFAVIANFFAHLTRRRVWLDRMLVQGKLFTVLLLTAAIFLTPVLFAGIFHLLKLDGSVFVNYGQDGTPNIFWSVLYHYIDPGNQHMANEGWPRAVACMIALLGIVFLNGILVSAFVGWYERFVDKWKTGYARYNALLKSKQFVAIIGGNECVPNIIRQLFQRDERIDFVVILTNQNVEELRKKLVSFLSPNEEKKVIIYSGERTSPTDIKDLQLEYAKEVFILGDSLEDNSYEASHDAISMECLNIIAGQLKENRCSRRRLVCKVMFEHQTSFSIYQFADISNEIGNYIDFRPFNYYESWAQRIFVNNKLTFNEEDHSGYLPLEGEKPLTYTDNNFVHLVIVGMSNMGTALGIEAAHLAHYPNFNRDKRYKTRITFIDKNCLAEKKFFQGRFKELFSLTKWREDTAEGNDNLYSNSFDDKNWKNTGLYTLDFYLGDEFIDIEWEFIQGSIEDYEIHKYLKEASMNENARFTLAICFTQDTSNVAAALYLPDEVYLNAIQILVYQRHNSAMINSLSLNNKINHYYKQLKPFGMLEEAYDDQTQEKTQIIASILKAEHKAIWTQLNKNKGNSTSSTPAVSYRREKSKAAERWSNIYHANSIWGKLRSINYGTKQEMTKEEIEILTKTEHNRWVVEQLLMRFRALTKEEQEKVLKGELTKAALKTEKMAHLDICSNEKLADVDDGVQEYDRGFIQIMPKLLKIFTFKTDKTELK